MAGATGPLVRVGAQAVKPFAHEPIDNADRQRTRGQTEQASRVNSLRSKLLHSFSLSAGSHRFAALEDSPLSSTPATIGMLFVSRTPVG